jgi:hypothetical protein
LPPFVNVSRRSPATRFRNGRVARAVVIFASDPSWIDLPRAPIATTKKRMALALEC